jgi:hypothetical protein
MKLIRIPIGTTENDKNKFIDEFLRVFPNNSKETVEGIWNRQVSVGVLQIIMDVDTGTVTQVMRVNEKGGTYWELSSNYLKTITLIYDFKPEDNPTLENPNQENIQQSNYTANTTPFNVDEILDIIIEKGYENLSKEHKTFLSKFSKK